MTEIRPTEARIPPAAPTVEKTNPTNMPHISGSHIGRVVPDISKIMSKLFGKKIPRYLNQQPCPGLVGYDNTKYVTVLEFTEERQWLTPSD